MENKYIQRHYQSVRSVMAAVLFLTAVLWGTRAAAAPPERAERVHSTGAVRYDRAVIDGQDVRDVDAYVTDRKNMAVNVMIRLGTKFRQQPAGGCTYDRNPDEEQGKIEEARIGWDLVIDAARHSQEVPGNMTVLHPEAALHIEGTGERTDWYAPAEEDNLSLGKAAWVNGRLLLGNGADNDRAFRKGIEDGKKGSVPDRLHPVYTAQGAALQIKHAHVGKAQDSEGRSGCYKNYEETKTQRRVCGASLHKTDKTWYPNPDEPGGGSWHGGEYTCPVHGGTYGSSGTCPHVAVDSYKVWKHDIVCGLTNKVYAKLTLQGTDSDYGDRAIRLEALLEEGAEYRRLAWQEGDELIWTDAGGNLVGIGRELTVTGPGIYRCSINVANKDINKKTVEVRVKINGLIIPKD